MTRPSLVWRVLEQGAWTAGIVCVSAWAVVAFTGAARARHDISRFEALRDQAATLAAAPPDLSLWSEPRVRAWRAALAADGPAPLAVLRIQRLRLEAPILEGTDDATPDRGVGHIDGTPEPGADGNTGLAGHRDGFFRVLKDITPGDTLELETLRATERYRVERTWIVTPDDVSVLDPTSSRAITLVTCYPFYFVGSAPQRFIVRAVQTTVSAAR